MNLFVVISDLHLWQSLTLLVVISACVVTAISTVRYFHMQSKYSIFSKYNNDFLVGSFAAIGALYGVFIAFTITEGIKFFIAAEDAVVDEFESLEKIKEISSTIGVDYPTEVATFITVVEDYVTSVVDEEWEYMSVYKKLRPETTLKSKAILPAIEVLRKSTSGYENHIERLISYYERIVNDRTIRASYSSIDYSFDSNALWTVVVIGAICNMTLFYCFNVNNNIVISLVMFSFLVLVGICMIVHVYTVTPLTGDYFRLKPMFFESLIGR